MHILEKKALGILTFTIVFAVGLSILKNKHPEYFSHSVPQESEESPEKPESRVITTQELTILQRDSYESGVKEANEMFASIALQDKNKGTNRPYRVILEEVKYRLDVP